MISLGIESTAHTFGIGIISDKGKVLSNEKSVYKPPLGRGIHPRKASQHHTENAPMILKNTLKKSGIKMKDVDIISFSQGPGLPNCLQVGASIGRYLSLKNKKPLVGVNHCISHIEIGKIMTGCKDPVVVYCSGGNTQIIAYVDGYYRIFGETEDIPLGNAFDVLAREFNLGMPGGPKIDALAKKGKWTYLPYVVKGMDQSFTGIVTECKRKYKRGEKKEDICYSFVETVFSMLTEVTERALAHTDKSEVLLTGGVAAAPRLIEMMKIMCKEREGKCYVVPKNYSGDNPVMIAWNGILAYKSKERTKISNSKIKKNWRTDEVKITWL
jgi:universal protein Kae1